MKTIASFRLMSPVVALMLLVSVAAQGKEARRHKVAQAAGTAASAVTVHIPKDATGKGPAAYGTNPLVVPAGTQVTWTNDDSVAHTATSESGVWDSSFILPGKSYSHVFDQPGTYPYYCTLHGKGSMSGTIEVK